MGCVGPCTREQGSLISRSPTGPLELGPSGRPPRTRLEPTWQLPGFRGGESNEELGIYPPTPAHHWLRAALGSINFLVFVAGLSERREKAQGETLGVSRN